VVSEERLKEDLKIFALVCLGEVLKFLPQTFQLGHEGSIIFTSLLKNEWMCFLLDEGHQKFLLSYPRFRPSFVESHGRDNILSLSKQYLNNAFAIRFVFPSTFTHYDVI